jgi:hypothetical protein
MPLRGAVEEAHRSEIGDLDVGLAGEGRGGGRGQGKQQRADTFPEGVF